LLVVLRHSPERLRVRLRLRTALSMRTRPGSPSARTRLSALRLKSRLDAVFGPCLTSDSMHSKRIVEFWLALFGWTFLMSAQERQNLPATQPLSLQGDLSAQMVAGIDAFLMRLIER